MRKNPHDHDLLFDRSQDLDLATARAPRDVDVEDALLSGDRLWPEAAVPKVYHNAAVGSFWRWPGDRNLAAWRKAQFGHDLPRRPRGMHEIERRVTFAEGDLQFDRPSGSKSAFQGSGIEMVAAVRESSVRLRVDGLRTRNGDLDATPHSVIRPDGAKMATVIH